MKPINLLETTDAAVWADEFVRYTEKNDWSVADMDHGLMIGWFANAMAAMEFEMNRRYEIQEKAKYRDFLRNSKELGVTIRNG